MPDKGTNKKLTRVEGGAAQAASAAKEARPFVASEESKGKAGRFRLFAIIAWIVAIGLEIGAIFVLKKLPINTTWLIVLIAADLIFAVIGNLLWKKANRFDPASEKDKFKFFVQNQLGAIIAVIAFLPLVILIFTNKDLKGKQKGLVGAVAVIALLIAGFTGDRFQPAVPGAVRGADGAGRAVDRPEPRFLDEVGNEVSLVLGLPAHQYKSDERDLRRDRRQSPGTEEHNRALQNLRGSLEQRRNPAWRKHA